MQYRDKKNAIIIIIALAAVLMSICTWSSAPSFSASAAAKISAIKSAISIFADSKKISSLTTLEYNGETYVPAKKFAELLGKSASIDAKTSKLSITDKTSQKNPVVILEMKTGEKAEIELYKSAAPITVANFLKLVDNGFYNGLKFHRVIDGFVIQGGDPKGDGTGGPGYQIKGEFMRNGVSNPILHEKGVISMARSSLPDSAGSQFFIMLDKNNELNGNYAAFGKVIKGIEVIEKIGKVETDESDRPLTEQVIKSIKRK